MWRLYSEFLGGGRAVALLILRVVAGSAMMFHGWGKVQNPMHWMGEAPIPGFLQAAAAFSEFGGGLCWVIGLLSPVASFFLMCTMGFATFGAHMSQGDVFVNTDHTKHVGSYESAAGYLAISILFLFVGPGRLSIDSLLFGRRPVVKPEPAQSLGG